MVAVDISAALADKYTAEELVEKLNISVTDILYVFEDTIEREFCEDGQLEDEWREFYGES